MGLEIGREGALGEGDGIGGRLPDPLRHELQLGRRLHGRGALAHGLEHAFDPGAEGVDRGIDGAAALFALAQRVALLFRSELFGHVGMGGEPTATAHRPAHQRDDAAVLEFDGFGFGSALSRLASSSSALVCRPEKKPM